jgi:hypothetical protein
MAVTRPTRDRIWDRVWRTIWPFFLAEQAADRPADNPVPDIVVYAFVAYGIWMALLLLTFGIGYQTIRRELGHAPTRDDLLPL